MGENIFSTLFESRPGSEDFLTEAYVFLLKLFLEREPNKGVPLVNGLSGLPQEAQFENPASVVVSNQVIVDEGRLDIGIRDEQDRLVYVEVKHDAPLGDGQLEYYWDKLQASLVQHKKLVLLTRSRVSARETTLDRDNYHHVCWYEIYNWLAEAEVQEEVCRYFTRSFMRFLEEKQMSMEKVSWEYIPGMSALLNLIRMMETSITEAIPDAMSKRTVGGSWQGLLSIAITFMESAQGSPRWWCLRVTSVIAQPTSVSLLSKTLISSL